MTGIVVADSLRHEVTHQYTKEESTDMANNNCDGTVADIIIIINFLYNCIVQLGFSHGKFGLLSLGKASCDRYTTQPTVHVGCLSVLIIHQVLTWTAVCLTCAQMLMHTIVHTQ